jgi:hypothetical protein
MLFLSWCIAIATVWILIGMVLYLAKSITARRRPPPAVRRPDANHIWRLEEACEIKDEWGNLVATRAPQRQVGLTQQAAGQQYVPTLDEVWKLSREQELTRASLAETKKDLIRLIGDKRTWNTRL